MNLDDITSLQGRGAKVGEANAHQWRELVTAYALDGVRFAIAKAKAASREHQVDAEAVAKALGHKLRGEAPKPRPLPVAAPASAPAPAPTLRAEGELRRLVQNEQAKHGGGPRFRGTRSASYLEDLRAHPGSTIADVAGRTGSNIATLRSWLSTHQNMVRSEGPARGPAPKRYWLKDAPEAQAAVRAGIEDCKAGRIGPPLDFSKPEFQDEEPEPAAATESGVDELPEPPASAAEPPADEPEPPADADDQVEAVSLLPTAPPLRAVAALAFTVTDDELGGELLPLVTRLLDVYADRHGFSRAYAETTALARRLFPTVA